MPAVDDEDSSAPISLLFSMLRRLFCRNAWSKRACLGIATIYPRSCASDERRRSWLIADMPKFRNSGSNYQFAYGFGSSMT